MLVALFAPAVSAAEAPVDERDALLRLWTGAYDLAEEVISGDPDLTPLKPLVVQQRVQIQVRRVNLPWLGSHVLYLEEIPYDEPFELKRRVLLAVEEAAGELRVRQYTRRAGAEGMETLAATQVESLAGCDLYLHREGGQFRGGTRARGCIATGVDGPSYLDYQVVIGDGLFWYRQRRLALSDDELIEEIAGFPHVALEQAQLFACRVSWSDSAERARRRVIDHVDLHDRGGRAHLRTPDGRELELELHGRDWPLSEGRESLVLILIDKSGSTIASSWTSLGAARVGLDIGWLAVDCAPVAGRTGEAVS